MTETTPSDALDQATGAFATVKQAYDGGGNDLRAIGVIAESCLNIIVHHSAAADQGTLGTAAQQKQYIVFKRNSGSKNISRPVLKDVFLADVSAFKKVWADFVNAIRPGSKSVECTCADQAVYTTIMAFACAFDLVKPTSRKTPGTFFEVVIGMILTLVSGRVRGKQVDLPGEKYKVPTDIYLMGAKDAPQLVIPTKITTRERIVQAWAHQRILEAVFGKGKYRSILVAASELQRDGDKGVHEICVPNQVGMFQEHLSEMSGMYYLDPPLSYVNADFAKKLPSDRSGSS